MSLSDDKGQGFPSSVGSADDVLDGLCGVRAPGGGSTRAAILVSVTAAPLASVMMATEGIHCSSPRNWRNWNWTCCHALSTSCCALPRCWSSTNTTTLVTASIYYLYHFMHHYQFMQASNLTRCLDHQCVGRQCQCIGPVRWPSASALVSRPPVRRLPVGGPAQDLPNFQMPCLTPKSVQTCSIYSPDGDRKVLLKKIDLFLINGCPIVAPPEVTSD